jgi:Spy/CpxP family protein refolding chaperone
MRRRLLIAFPGVAALVASRAFGEVQQDADQVIPIAPHVSRKALATTTGSKAAYELPHNAAKQARYLGSLTALLGLTPTQQQQAAGIFTSAVTTRGALHSTLKAARKSLSAAVKANDIGSINQASTTLGGIMTQYVSNGALANAAFYEILTASQQATLSQYTATPTSKEA